MPQTQQSKFFLGYWILLAGFLLFFIYSGVGFYAFAVFFKPIQGEFGWGREVTSIAFTIFYILQAASSPFIGKLTDHYGPKKIITLGGIFLSAGLALLSLTNDLLSFYIGYGVMGLGTSGMGMIPVSHVISDWFRERRGMAIGVVSSGLGIGGSLIPIMIGLYLIPSFGWRTTYQILAVSSILLITPITQLLIKPNPEIIEPHIGASKQQKEELSNSSEVWTLNSALKTSTFWLIASSFTLFQLSQVGTTQHLVNHLTDIGFPLTMATTIFSVTSLTTAGGKFFFGYISDKFKAKYCAILSFLCGLTATAVLLVLDTSSSPLIIGVYIICMGLAVGGWAPLSSMLISTSFGMKNYAAIFGAFSLFFYLSTGVSPAYFGYVYDTTHQYYYAYVLSLVFYSVAIALMLATRSPKHKNL
ncbi:MAG: transporter [Thermoproteota archaeon]|nr:transporter [Thermoproteota archaeon]